jgi:c-di-GMP-binding flagellar brake protein YcgR
MQSDSAATGVLVRSKIEIARILETIRSGGEPLTAFVVGGEQRFTSRLLRVDSLDGFILVDFSPNETANTALLAQESVTFRCNDGPAHLEFVARAPREAQHQDRAAIRFPLPEALARLHRRAHPRIGVGAVAGSASLRCIADSAGANPFEARVTDVSPGGLGTIVYNARVRLAPGMQLPRTKIIFPMGRTVLVNLEVCHVQPVTLEDGTPAQRAGCRFIAGSRDLAELIRVYAREIGAE